MNNNSVIVLFMTYEQLLIKLNILPIVYTFIIYSVFNKKLCL